MHPKTNISPCSATSKDAPPTSAQPGVMMMKSTDFFAWVSSQDKSCPRVVKVAQTKNDSIPDDENDGELRIVADSLDSSEGSSASNRLDVSVACEAVVDEDDNGTVQTSSTSSSSCTRWSLYKRQGSLSSSSFLNSICNSNHLMNEQDDMRPHVTFSEQAQVREYPIILGDHPYCADGLALTLDWEYNQGNDDDKLNSINFSYTMDLVDRTEPYQLPRRLTYEERRDRLFLLPGATTASSAATTSAETSFLESSSSNSLLLSSLKKKLIKSHEQQEQKNNGKETPEEGEDSPKERNAPKEKPARSIKEDRKTKTGAHTKREAEKEKSVFCEELSVEAAETKPASDEEISMVIQMLQNSWSSKKNSMILRPPRSLRCRLDDIDEDDDNDSSSGSDSDEDDTSEIDIDMDIDYDIDYDILDDDTEISYDFNVKDNHFDFAAAGAQGGLDRQAKDVVSKSTTTIVTGKELNPLEPRKLNNALKKHDDDAIPEFTWKRNITQPPQSSSSSSSLAARKGKPSSGTAAIRLVPVPQEIQVIEWKRNVSTKKPSAIRVLAS